MPRIEYDKSDEKEQISPQDWNNGHYLMYNKLNKKYVIISKFGDVLHFHRKCSYWHKSNYPDFYEAYKLIGKIKDFKISEIELEDI